MRAFKLSLPKTLSAHPSQLLLLARLQNQPALSAAERRAAERAGDGVRQRLQLVRHIVAQALKAHAVRAAGCAAKE